MGKQLIMVKSITYAMKGREILTDNGIKSYIERTPKRSKAYSCGYCLYVPENTDKAEEILQNAGIKVVGREEKEAIS